MATWNDLIVAAKNRDLIRKSLDAIVLVAEKDVALATTITGAADALVLPPNYKPLGWHSDDGLAWAREVENSDLGAHGSTEPVRSDVRRVNNTLEVTALETNILTLGMTLGIDLDPDAGDAGEVRIIEPNTPKAREFRVLALSLDDTDFGEIYYGKQFTAAKVTSSSLGAWSDGDNAQSYGLTLTAFRDATAGHAVEHFIGGPGFAGLREAMGWNEAS